MKSITVNVGGKRVTFRVGEWVGFKCDIEQHGRIEAIRGRDLVLVNENGFRGDYIHGHTRRLEPADFCWKLSDRERETVGN